MGNFKHGKSCKSQAKLARNFPDQSDNLVDTNSMILNNDPV